MYFSVCVEIENMLNISSFSVCEKGSCFLHLIQAFGGGLFSLHRGAILAAASWLECMTWMTKMSSLGNTRLVGYGRANYGNFSCAVVKKTMIIVWGFNLRVHSRFLINLMFLFLPLVVGFGTLQLLYNFTLVQGSLNNVWVSVSCKFKFEDLFCTQILDR